MPEGSHEYHDIVLFLVTAGIVVPLFRRAKLSPILGFLAAGVVLGPSGLGSLVGRDSWLSAFTIADPAEVAQLAELGVVFLLFMIGLELSWERLRLMRRLVFGLGALQVSLCGAVIATGAVLLGQPVSAAAAIGAALALSSTAIVMPLLVEAGLFFLSVGIGLDLSLLSHQPLLIVGLALGLMVLNGTVIFTLAKLFGLTARNAIEAAFLLAAAGEFAFVILSSAMAKGVVDRSVAQTILVASTLSMFFIPFLASMGARKQWETATKAAGITDVHFHDLRGTAVTMLAEAGCTTPQIAAITGHSLKTVTGILDKYLARTRVLASEAVTLFENAKSTDFANRLQTGPQSA